MVIVEDIAICDNCIILFNGLIKPSAVPSLPPKTSKKTPLTQLNSLKIKEFLDQYVIGQEAAKMALCVSVVNHYKRMLYSKEAGVEINKSNLLITGPSGSGKSLLISTVAKFLNVPFISVDATTLTEAGYICQNVDTIISRLVIEANGDITAAEGGIVFIDEIDKIANGKTRGTLDGKINGIQSALLKMIEGAIIPLPTNPDSKKHPSSKNFEVNTQNVLFIVGGAFVGLDEIVSTRLKKKTPLGFSEKPQTNPDIASEYRTEDFIEYGMIPEFIGRFPLKTHTTELTEQELIEVLTKSKQNILDEYKFYFDIDDIELHFTPDFIEQVAHTAKTEKTGVRGLRTICDNVLMPHLYLIPEYQKRQVAKITFNHSCINQKQIPKIEIYEKVKKLVKAS